MTERKTPWTKGLWHARFENVRYVIYVETDIGEKALATTGGAYPDSAPNAALIAAAPEMAELLAEARDDFEAIGEFADTGEAQLCWETAARAIAKINALLTRIGAA